MSEKLTELNVEAALPSEQREVEGDLKSEILKLLIFLMNNGAKGSDQGNRSWSIPGIRCVGTRWEIKLSDVHDLPGTYDIDISEIIADDDCEKPPKDASFTLNVKDDIFQDDQSVNVTWNGGIYREDPDEYIKITPSELSEIFSYLKNIQLTELKARIRRSMLRIVK